MTIPEIICKYREKLALTQTGFANALMQSIPGSLTKQAVSLWETGTQKPSYFFLVSLTLHYNDWRREMAKECLAVLKPDLYRVPHG